MWCVKGAYWWESSRSVCREFAVCLYRVYRCVLHRCVVSGGVCLRVDASRASGCVCASGCDVCVGGAVEGEGSWAASLSSLDRALEKI